MALKLDIFTHVRGEQGMELLANPLGRVEGMTDKEYRTMAHSFADAKRHEFKVLGMSAVVDVVRLDGKTPEEIQQRQEEIADSVEHPQPDVLTTNDVLIMSNMRAW